MKQLVVILFTLFISLSFYGQANKNKKSIEKYWILTIEMDSDSFFGKDTLYFRPINREEMNHLNTSDITFELYIISKGFGGFESDWQSNERHYSINTNIRDTISVFEPFQDSIDNISPSLMATVISYGYWRFSKIRKILKLTSIHCESIVDNNDIEDIKYVGTNEYIYKVIELTDSKLVLVRKMKRNRIIC